MRSSMPKYQLLQLPSHPDFRGKITVIEFLEHFDWTPQRAYWITEGSGVRGNHAHREEIECFLALQGTFDIKIHDGKQENIFTLKGPTEGIIVYAMGWHELRNFSQGSVVLGLSSIPYDQGAGYITDFQEFLNITQ